MKNQIKVLLPDGSEFVSWEKEVLPSRTYHVAQQHPEASDSNDGSMEQPFLTISRAAEVLKPGEEVVIHEGLYRECVRPARGGESPEKMITYRAAEGEKVVLDGSDIWETEWCVTKWMKRDFYQHLPIPVFISYEATLKSSQFKDGNPFGLTNGYIGGKDWTYCDGFSRKRGMIFVDGEELHQVDNYYELGNDFSGAGVFWVEDNGLTIHLRLRGEENPNNKTIEITTREQIFVPCERYLNYIKISGLHLQRVANAVPIPWPQKGMLSANAGHHWIIEDCELGYANTIGMDLGGGWWYYGKGECQGYHIIRRNYIHHIGVCGIAGWHNMGNRYMLVEDNYLSDNCRMNITEHCENAAIKIHRTEHSLVRRNVIVNTHFGSAIWLDGEIYNTRITQNVCLMNKATGPWGQMFVEINRGPNLVDNNILYGSKRHPLNNGWSGLGNGFYCHDAERIILVQNLICNDEDFAIYLKAGDPARTTIPYSNHHRIYGNILGGYNGMILLPNETSRSDKNIFACEATCLVDGFAEMQDYYEPAENMGIEAWIKKGYDKESVIRPILIEIDVEKLELRAFAYNKETLPEFSMPVDLVDYEHLPYTPEGDEPMTSFAESEKLFAYDLFGRDRKSIFTAGPIIDLPLDGTPISIDPRGREV